MNVSMDNMSDTSGWPVSTANFTNFNSTQQTESNGTVDEYAQLVIHRFQYINLAVRLAMGLIAFFSNLLTIVAIATFEYLRSCTNYLVAYLAFADMLAGINTMLLVANYLTPMSDELWITMCAIEQSVSLMAAGFNIMAILGISLDRLIFVTRPLHYHAIVTDRVTGIFISLCTTFILGVIGGIHCCGYNYLPDRICRGAFSNNYGHINIIFYILSILIILPNIRIAYIAYKQKKAIALGQPVSETRAKQNKITKMLAMVLGVYYGCYVPQSAVLITYRFIPRLTYGVIIERVASWFWWVNSWSNPPIYAWKNKEFNKAFRTLLHLRSNSVDPALG